MTSTLSPHSPGHFPGAPGAGVFIIAEAGVNHNGDPALAQELIDVAVRAGADAVKFQLFHPDELTSRDGPLADYQRRSGERNQREMLERLTLPHDAYRFLKAYAEKQGIGFITTPFDAQSATFLVAMGVTILKIPSGEITNIPFLEHVAGLGRFTILSTGMSTMDEVRDAVRPFLDAGTPFALLHCVSAYPTPVDQVNLRAMDTLREAFCVPVGFSDHTEGIAVAITAVVQGASIVEKHFTLDRSMPGPDHAASLEPVELQKMIRIIRDPHARSSYPQVVEALGTGEKICQPCEKDVRSMARRSLIAAKDIAARQMIARDMIVVQRPGTGIAPKFLSDVLGKKSIRPLAAGTVLTLDMFA